MPTSINVGDKTVTEALRAGSRMTITMDASSTALVQWYRGDTYVSEKSLIASEVFKLGEFRVDMMVRITCLTGTMTYTDAAEDTGLLVGRATKTNDDAAAGEIGEVKTTTVATASSVSLTTATAKDVATLALTPGDWEVWGQVNRNWSGTTATIVSTGISLTADTMPTQPGGSGIGTDPLHTDTATFGTTLTGIKSQRCGPVRVSLSATTTTLHLVAQDTFSAGTVTAFGTITARRVR